MKYVKSLALVLTALCGTASAQSAPLVEAISALEKNLFKLSAQELCQQLNIQEPSISTISADTLKHKMAQESDLLLVNVLPEKYHNDCHIAGSINAPLPQLIKQAQAWDRSQPIIIYCALEECDAGEKGCILLSCIGFTNVLDYTGGIKEWYQLGYPTNGPAQEEYLHTKGFAPLHQEYRFYPSSIVCSMQTRWIHKYQK